MKKADNFDAAKWLVENKITTNSTLKEKIQESLLDTSKYIEPQDMEDVLEKIYHILSGNVRDYISIPNIEQVIKILKQYDKTQYSKSDLSES
jgi:sortase (surface protein transpeptidase)